MLRTVSIATPMKVEKGENAMVVLCVGPDCAGKTSMVSSLVEREGQVLRKQKVQPPFTESVYDELIDMLKEQLEGKRHIIWDRIPLIDDLVYSHAMEGRKSYYEVSGQLERIKALLKRCLIVYVTAESGKLIERAHERAGENDKYLGRELAEEQLNEIRSEYDDVFRQLGVEQNVYEINTTEMTKELAAETLKFIYDRNGSQRKNQKIAHIVPKASLYMTADNQYHMCLAQNCGDAVYLDFFKRRAKEGKFVLLDNGAAEDTTTGTHRLFELAKEIGASEVILPDMLEDMNETLKRTEEAYREWIELPRHDFDVMVVPQGKDLDEWKMCAEKLVDMCPSTAAFGIPKALARNAEHPYQRYYAAEYLSQLLDARGRKAEIHLLGMNEPPLVISAIFESLPRVRGIDSAFAFLCTQALQPISNPYVERPSGKIDFLNGPDLSIKLDINMQLLNLCINHNNNDVDYTWSIER